jgi:hypothetical protein
MPGGGRYQWQWIGKPPIYLTFGFWLVGVEFVVGWVMFVTLPQWGRTTSDAAHPVELRTKFGHVYYLSPEIAWFLKNDLWIFFTLLGLLLLILLFHRDKLERVR